MRSAIICVCWSSSLCSTMPSLTTAAMRSSRLPVPESSSAGTAVATDSNAHVTNNRFENNDISGFGLGGDGGVSTNRAPQESLVVDSDTRQPPEFQLQPDRGVRIAGAAAHEVPRHQAQRPATRAVLETDELVERLVVEIGRAHV